MTSSRHTTSCAARQLGLSDVQEFYLSYLTNEYSPRPISRRFLVPNTSFVQVNPEQKDRWLRIGEALHRHTHGTASAHTFDAQAGNDMKKIWDILLECKLPIAAIGQLQCIINDFRCRGRFSRIRKKLERTAQWDALAARLLHDQNIILGLFRPKTEGFLMSDHPAEAARRNIQIVTESKFTYIKDLGNFKVNRRTLLRQRIPVRSEYAQLLIDAGQMDAYKIAKSKRPPSWIHFHREHIDVEDLLDLEEGEALHRRIEFTRDCEECGCPHLNRVTVIVAAHDDLADGHDAPPSYDERAV